MKVNKLIMQLLQVDGEKEIVLSNKYGSAFHELESLVISDCQDYLILNPNYEEIAAIATGEYLEAENGFTSAPINMEE